MTDGFCHREVSRRPHCFHRGSSVCSVLSQRGAFVDSTNFAYCSAAHGKEAYPSLPLESLVSYRRCDAMTDSLVVAGVSLVIHCLPSFSTCECFDHFDAHVVLDHCLRLAHHFGSTITRAARLWSGSINQQACRSAWR